MTSPMQGGDAAPRKPSHAERCRTLAALARTATLSTIARDPAGHPFGSLVAVASDGLGRPLLLLSQLAEHTQNLQSSERASVLFTEAARGDDDVLALARVTVLGACRPIPESERDRARATYLEVHPRAASYVDFKDFGFYALAPLALRYVGGFGRMSWVTAEAYRTAEPDPLAASAPGILAHMNDDHADAVLLYAKVLAGCAAATAARMTAVDRYGFDVGITEPSGSRTVRLGFDREPTTSDAVRAELISLLQRARAAS